MKSWMQAYSRIIIFLIFLLAFAVLIVHFITLSYGFYFGGDTINYFVPAYPGKKGDLLSVFIWHYNNYPPFVSYVFNLLRFLPFSFITQHHIYVILATLLTTFISYLITKIITPIKKWRIVLVSLLLFTGSQSIIFLTALAEPLFVFLWLSSTLSIERFMSTKKERYLMLFVFTAGLIPIVKIQGIPVVASFEIIIFFFAYFTWKQKKYSISLLFLSLLLAWLPFFIHLIMNFTLHHTFFGYFDPQRDLDQKKLGFQLITLFIEILKDSVLLLLSGFIIGTQIKWNKHIKSLLILTCFSSASYFIFIAYGLTQIAVNEVLHLRYSLPLYPQLILASICTGSIFIYRFSRFHKVIIISLILVVLTFGYKLSTSINMLIYEINSPQSFFKSLTEGTGVEHSADIRRFCRGKTPNKYLLVQSSSRNWVAQSLGYYCQPIEIIRMENQEIFKLPHNSLIFSPYQLTNPQLKVVDLYKGDKKVILYKAENSVVLDIKEVLNDLDSLN